AKGADGGSVDVDTIDENRACGKFIETRKQIYKSCFPRAAGTHQGDDFTFARLKANVFEHDCRTVFVSKTHIFKFDKLRKGSQDFRAGLFDLFFHSIEIGKNLHASSLRG